MKLSTGKEVELIDMSVDDMDTCMDLKRFAQEVDGFITVYNVAKSNTAWIRKGVKNADDKFIKSLSEAEKLELVTLIQKHNQLGE